MPASARTPQADDGVVRPSGGASLRLNFNEAPDDQGDFEYLDNAGSTALAIYIVSSDGGEVARKRSRQGPPANGAARLPRLDSAADAPRAVVRVRDRRGPDDLNPRRGDFSFGADFSLDATSEDTGDGSHDNGDNLIQRGLFDAASQYKLQLDHRTATCRIKGSAGTVAVSSSRLRAGVWYRVLCARDGSRVTLTLTRWDDNGQAHTSRARAAGPIGTLTPATRSTPLSIGGKLTPQGRVVKATDQFNGRIDNVRFTIG